MTTLNKVSRAKIVTALLEHKFAAPIVALTQQRAALAQAVYEDIYSTAQRQMMTALPSGWLPTESCVTVKFAASHARIHFDGSFNSTPSYSETLRRLTPRTDGTHARLFAYQDSRGGLNKVYDANHSLAVRYAEIDGDARKLAEQIAQAEAVATQAVNRFNSVARLVDSWPEIAPFVPQSAGTVPNLPAMVAADLNAVFDLPVSA